MQFNYLTSIFIKSLNCVTLLKIFNDYLTLVVRVFDLKLESIIKIFAFLKTSTLTRFNMLVELTAYDVPKSPQRFTLNYFLLSVEYNTRLAINVPLNSSVFASVSSIYQNSSWAERELRDMFGIFFTSNYDLRRLLTDYGFEGFPLRKDFPLTGYLEVRYDDEVQHILYEPVQLSQEFRAFSLTSPWERHGFLN